MCSTAHSRAVTQLQRGRSQLLKLALEVVEVDRLGNAAFGNSTHTAGRFRECFAGSRFAHRWSPQQIDSRSVAMTNKAQIAAWVKDHGEDSDFIRVRVRGVFPRTGSLQFIDSERVDEAVARLLVEDPTAPLIMGVDIARQGADQSVIRFRRGLDARSIPAVEFRIPDPMQIASRIMEQVNSYNPDAMFVDGTGIGWGVHDRLKQSYPYLPLAKRARTVEGGGLPDEEHPMGLQDDQLNRLFEAVVIARRRYVATGFADASKTPTEIEETTLDELEEADAAEEAWKAANQALADYKSAKLWGTLTR
jgi:hypothetical protein